QQLLAGLAPAGIGLLLGMVLKLAARLPRRGLPWALALLTFAAVAALQLPLWLVLLVLAPLAVVLAWRWPQPGA
ncbi:MAG: chromate transporter, partial [Vogesella sp.]